jgi:DNA-binding CsgD family transcriptional regulator
VSQALGFLSETEYRLGHLEEAVLHAELAASEAAEAGRVWDLPMLHTQACYARSARGDFDEARAHAQEASNWALLMGTGAAQSYAAAGAASLAGATGDDRGLLEAGTELARTYTALEPGTHLEGGALSEVLVRTGLTEEAASALVPLAEAVAATGRRSGQMALMRCRGALSMAAHDVMAGRRAFEESARIAIELEMPLEAAKSLLAAGRAAVASGDRAWGSVKLEQAAKDFDRLRAKGYVDLAALALTAAEGRGEAVELDAARSAYLHELTPAEGAVARLAASRFTNREIAERLMVSAKTVEYHLGHAYRKLGVRSRHELVRLFEA